MNGHAYSIVSLASLLPCVSAFIPHPTQGVANTGSIFRLPVVEAGPDGNPSDPLKKFAPRPDDRRNQEDTRSLGQKMFGDLFKPFFPDEKPEKTVTEQGPLDASRAISDIDVRAASGNITYQDFIAMSRTFVELDGKVPGMPSLSATEIEETKAKFRNHEKIVQAMTPEELKDPQLMVDDLDSINTGKTKGPRTQRLAVESGISEKDVLLCVAELEARRESTKR